MTDALDLVGSLVLEDGRTWADAAHDFQSDDARAVLDLDGPRMHFLTRPRGGSKTTDLAAVAVGILLDQAPPSSRSYAVASDSDQAGLLVDALRGLVGRSNLSGALKVETRRVVNVRTHATLEVLASDGASAYGLKPFLVIADELSVWPSTPNAREVWTAVLSSVPKLPDSRLVVLTSAGAPSHWSAKVLAHARQSSAWHTHEVEGPCPWIAEDALAEQRALLTESQYARLHLNRWTEPEDSLTTADDLRACVTLADFPLEPAPGQRYVALLDVGLTFDATVLAVMHAEHRMGPDGPARRFVLDRLDRWRGTRANPVQLDQVEAQIVEVARAYGVHQVVADPYQAAQLLQRLGARGIRAEPFTFSSQSVGRLALGLHRAIRDHAIALPDEPELLEELERVKLRETAPGCYRLDTEPGAHDDQAIVLALGVQVLGATYAGPMQRPDVAALNGARLPAGRQLGRPLLPAGMLQPGVRRLDGRYVPAVGGRRDAQGRPFWSHTEYPEGR